MGVSFLYFDLGNVLLRFSHERMCQQIAELTGLDAETVRAAIQEPAGESPQLQFETGLLNEAQYHEAFCNRLGVRPSREAFFDAASDIFAAIPETASLVERLAGSGNRLGVLSNTSAADWRFVMANRFPFLNEHFEHYALSFEVGSMKPDRRIFDYAVEKTGLPTSEVFFVDDREENVAGAIAAGLDAVQFTSFEQLCRDLEVRGVAGA